MPVHQMPSPSRRLPVAWAVALSFDFLATVLTALAL